MLDNELNNQLEASEERGSSDTMREQLEVMIESVRKVLRKLPCLKPELQAETVPCPEYVKKGIVLVNPAL